MVGPLQIQNAASTGEALFGVAAFYQLDKMKEVRKRRNKIAFNSIAFSNCHSYVNTDGNLRMPWTECIF